jgi:Sec-independent protein translocase protein TatA
MGIGLSEILLILALIVVFVDSKKIPGLAGKCLKTVKQLRAAAKKYLDEVSR